MHRPGIEKGRLSTLGDLTPEQRKERIDLGLALLQSRCVPGVPLTQDDLAAWCGCSSAAINCIEQAALRKLATRLMAWHDPVARDLLSVFFPARYQLSRHEYPNQSTKPTRITRTESVARSSRHCAERLHRRR